MRAALRGAPGVVFAAAAGFVPGTAGGNCPGSTGYHLGFLGADGGKYRSGGAVQPGKTVCPVPPDEKVCAVETPPRLLPPLALSSCKGYIRDTLSAVGETLVRGRRVPVGALPPGADFFRYRRVSPNAELLPFHLVVQRRIDALGCDYRFEIAPHPVEALRRRDRDETGIGR